MEDWRKKGMVVWLVVVVGLVVEYAVAREPVLYRVGDKLGWSENVNYTEWATHQHFYVGDWLYFGFDKHRYNVLEVNKTSYDNCKDRNFIKNITRGGRDVFNLTKAQPYYFLSSGGYCYHGMKLAINVEEFSLTPAPSPAKNGSPSSGGSWLILSVLLTISMIWAILFKSD